MLPPMDPSLGIESSCPPPRDIFAMKGLPVGPEAVRAPLATGGCLRGRTWLPSQQAEAAAGRSRGAPQWAAGSRLGHGSRSSWEPKPAGAVGEAFA